MVLNCVVLRMVKVHQETKISVDNERNVLGNYIGLSSSLKVKRSLSRRTASLNNLSVDLLIKDTILTHFILSKLNLLHFFAQSSVLMPQI